MKKLMMIAALAALGCGCVSTHKNDGGDASLQVPVVKDIVHEKYEIKNETVTGEESLNVLFGLIVWGKTATHYADAAPYRFFDKIGEAQKLTCEIFGYPAKITGVELIENKSLPCCCDKK